MTTKIKIQYDWSTFSPLELLMTLIPFHAKKYVMKWIQCRTYLDGASRCWHWANSIEVKALPYAIMIVLDLSKHIASTLPNPIIIYGMSFKDAWQKMLNALVKLENMKNEKELCEWLDTLNADDCI